MTLKIYVPRDGKDREWSPDNPHEVRACEWLVKKAWTEFSHLKELYAILLNLQFPNPRADMLVIHERGLGVLELKDYRDEIHIRWDGPWTTGKDRREVRLKNHLNPREQVRQYAADLRNLFVYDLLPSQIKDDQTRWNEFKFQTGVCFTNHLAVLEEALDFVERRPPPLEPWEHKFSIFDLDFFTTWVRELRFGLSQGPSNHYEPVRLEPPQIVKIATEALDMIEWTEIYPAMLTGHPYGALVLEDEFGRQVFHLVRDQTLVGRSHKCEVDLPARYGRVSKEHCVIEWLNGDIYLVDKPSRNGTYLNDKPVTRRILKNGDVISLGGSSSNSHACILKFELYTADKTWATEEATKYGQDTQKVQEDQHPPTV